MGLTKNLKHTGRAAWEQRRDERDAIDYQNDAAKKEQESKDLQEEKELMQRMISMYGDDFVNWYDSPAVPERGKARDRINLIRAWEAANAPSFLDGLTAPVRGCIQDNRVHWFDVPETYTAVWTDEPGITRFSPKQMPDPQQNGSGKELPAMDGQTREAMKKPAQTNNTTKE